MTATVSNSVVQATPKVRESAWWWLRCWCRGRGRAAAATPRRRRRPPCPATPVAGWRTGSTRWRAAGHPYRSRAVHGHRCDHDRRVLLEAGVGQRHVIEQRGPARGPRSGEADDGRGPSSAGDCYRIPFPQPECGQCLGVQPDHATTGVRRRGVEPRGEREFRHVGNATDRRDGVARAGPPNVGRPVRDGWRAARHVAPTACFPNVEVGRRPSAATAPRTECAAGTARRARSAGINGNVTSAAAARATRTRSPAAACGGTVTDFIAMVGMRLTISAALNTVQA